MVKRTSKAKKVRPWLWGVAGIVLLVGAVLGGRYWGAYGEINKDHQCTCNCAFLLKKIPLS